MNRIASRTAAGLLALALALPAAVFAQEGAAVPAAEETLRQGLHLGPVNIDLSLAVSETYSDNLFATPENTESGFYTTVTPEIHLSFAEEYDVKGFTAGVSLDSINARHFEDLSRIDWRVYANYEFTIKELLKIEIGDEYTPRHLEPFESTTGGVEKYTANEAYVGLKYDFLDLWQARLRYSNTIYDYVESPYRSRVENKISTGLYFRILPKTSVFGSYAYNDIEYDDPASTISSIKQDVSVGAEWEITEITRGTASVGYKDVDFGDPSEKDWGTWIASLELRHELTELATVSVRGGRDIDEGKYEDTGYIFINGLGAKLTYQFLEQLAGKVAAGYYFEEFSETNPGDLAVRKDESARAGLGLVYTFRSWLQFDLTYEYLDRNSNIDRYSAVENTVEIKATARY